MHPSPPTEPRPYVERASRAAADRAPNRERPRSADATAQRVVARAGEAPSVARAGTRDESTSPPRADAPVAADEAPPHVERAPRFSADPAPSGERPGPPHAPARPVVAPTREASSVARAATRDESTGPPRADAPVAADEAPPHLERAPHARADRSPTGERSGPPHAPAQRAIARKSTTSETPSEVSAASSPRDPEPPPEAPAITGPRMAGRGGVEPSACRWLCRARPPVRPYRGRLGPRKLGRGRTMARRKAGGRTPKYA